jgi:murein DD-endopeptidase MepM/ murein hydrolase activator NlpD
VSATGAVPENKIEGGRLVYPVKLPPGLAASALDLGNHVIIDHGNGEFSQYAHLQHESVTVRVGDRVSAGQQIGRIGFSGDTGFHVHLHYGLVTGTEISSLHALPAYFTNFRRLLGTGAIAVSQGSVDSGDLIEATP